MRLLNRFSKKKIFVVGFNNCGTRTLHSFFRRNYIRSVHWQVGKNYIAAKISHNLSSGRPVLHGIDTYTAFSDLCFFSDDAWIEANQYFPKFHEQYSDAFFIFNDRPVDNWIRSRSKRRRLVERALRYFKADEATVEAIWREQYATHRDALLAYAPRMEHFLHFDIERDSPERLVTFLGSSFTVSAKYYRHEGKTSRRRKGRLGVPPIDEDG